MPKIGMEPERRRALIVAAVGEIGAAGSLDVTVGQIARRAGMSTALAHHYFGSKEQIFLAAMRHVMARFGDDVRTRLAAAETPRARLDALIAASFTPAQFEPEVAAAWLVFYVRALSSPDTARLLTVYTRRLHSNLTDALIRLLPRAEAERLARTTAALIDGFYLRSVVPVVRTDSAATQAMVASYLDTAIAAARS